MFFFLKIVTVYHQVDTYLPTFLYFKLSENNFFFMNMFLRYILLCYIDLLNCVMDIKIMLYSQRGIQVTCKSAVKMAGCLKETNVCVCQCLQDQHAKNVREVWLMLLTKNAR